MNSKGYDQGSMTPVVESYAAPEASYSQKQFGTTTNYIARQDRTVVSQAKEVNKQAYKGRYND